MRLVCRSAGRVHATFPINMSGFLYFESLILGVGVAQRCTGALHPFLSKFALGAINNSGMLVVITFARRVTPFSAAGRQT